MNKLSINDHRYINSHGLDAYFEWAHKCADSFREKHAFALLFLALVGCTSAPTHVIVKQNPPQFFSGIVTYRNNHIQKLFVSSDRFLTCTDALRDTNAALAKLLGEAPDGAAAKGLCIPVPTLDVSDLVPRELF